MYFEYETPVCSLVIIWSTPSSRNAQVVAKSAFAGGIGYAIVLFAILNGYDEEKRGDVVKSQTRHATDHNALVACTATSRYYWSLYFYSRMNARDSAP